MFHCRKYHDKHYSIWLNHGKFFFWLICTLQFLLLDIPKYLIRNNGLMGIGIKIPLHKAIVFDLGAASADGFLE